MKRYVMTRRDGRPRVLVYGRPGNPTPLKHLVRHSPDGFEWGYGGSGPADLARSIVGDVMGRPDPPPAIYQRVKAALVATLPAQGGEITSEEVCDIIEEVLES